MSLNFKWRKDTFMSYHVQRGGSILWWYKWWCLLSVGLKRYRIPNLLSLSNSEKLCEGWLDVDAREPRRKFYTLTAKSVKCCVKIVCWNGQIMYTMWLNPIEVREDWLFLYSNCSKLLSTFNYFLLTFSISITIFGRGSIDPSIPSLSSCLRPYGPVL